MEQPRETRTAVLIAGPDGRERDRLAQLVEAAGGVPLLAGDGAEALQLLRKGGVAAAVVDDDLVAPGTMEILGAVRAGDPTVPVVVVSASADPRRVARAIREGARDVLPKPVVEEDLAGALGDVLAAPLGSTAVPGSESASRTRRLEALGRLTGGVVHDFNNLLTVVNGYAHMLLHGLTADSPLRAYATEIVRAVEHGTALTQQLLAVRGKPPALAAVDLNEATRAAARLLQPLLGTRVTLVLDLAPVACPVRIAPGQLEQVVMNLAINSRDAMPQGGTLFLRTECDASSGWAWLVVSDTGVGMNRDTQARLFEPFFTTKGPGRGTGLGLVTVHRIVTAAGGRIEVQSAPGRGTTFTVALPLTAEIDAALDRCAGQPR